MRSEFSMGVKRWDLIALSFSQRVVAVPKCVIRLVIVEGVWVSSPLYFALFANSPMLLYLPATSATAGLKCATSTFVLTF